METAIKHEIHDLENVCSQPTYKEWKLEVPDPEGVVRRGSQPTYKEWKLGMRYKRYPYDLGFPAYLQGMETTEGRTTGTQGCSVPSLPTRNGNYMATMRVRISREGSQPTYKEWKPPVPLGEPEHPPGSQPTYKEWKRQPPVRW